MKNHFLITSILGCSILFPISAKDKETWTPVPIQITTTPPRALVFLSHDSTFDEKTALCLGTTPLLRNLNLSNHNNHLQLIKPGYREWNGTLTPETSIKNIVLEQLSEQENKKNGFYKSPMTQEMTVIPLRIRVQPLSKKDQKTDNTTESLDFKSRMLTSFEKEIRHRFQEKAKIQEVLEWEDENFVQNLLDQIKNIRLEKIGYTTFPISLHFDPKDEKYLSSLQGTILFLRGEAWYEGKGKKILKGLLPILLTAGSVSIGYNAAINSGASGFAFNIFGALPSTNTVLLQMFLVHSQTKELLWYGQVLFSPAHFKTPEVIEKTAVQGAKQIPSMFILKSELST
jgi:hypothetical protein